MTYRPDESEQRVIAWLRDGIEKDRAAMGRAGARADYKTAAAYLEAMHRDELIASAIEQGHHTHD